MKNTLNTALLPFACAALMLVHCAKKKEDPGNTGQPRGDTMADAEAVRQARNALMITYASGESTAGVTANITLPLTGADGVSIAWASSNDAVIDVETAPGTGMVTRPDGMDTMVILTARLTKNEASDTRDFILTVLAEPQNDAEAVMQAKNALMITYASGESDGRVTENITLPLTGANRVSITWTSGNDAVIDVETTPGTGMVTRPGSMDTVVTLTARLTKNEASDTRDFTLTVSISEDGQAVLQAKNVLMITYAEGDSRTSVKKNITFPLTGANGVSIAWTSGNDAVIDVETTPGTGMVTRPGLGQQDAEVTLTATLSKGDAANQMKTFSLTVIARLFAWSKVALAEGSSIWRLRSFHTTVVLNNKIWVLGGGVNFSSNLENVIQVNDVWSSSDGTTWAQTMVMGTHWSARRNAAVVLGSNIWVLGGEFKKDVWSSSDGVTWAETTVMGTHWSGRSFHAAVVFNNEMWVLGGIGISSRHNDVWSSSDGMSWTNANARGPAVEPATDPVTYRSHWSARRSHAAVVFNEKIWVLGGDGGSNKDDVWSSSDGTDWAQTTVTGTHWSARSDHAAVVFDNKIWVMGGDDGSTKNDVWWSSDGASWTKLTNGTSHWSAREGHAVVVLGDKMFLMGGWTGSAALNDVWVYQETD